MKNNKDKKILTQQEIQNLKGLNEEMIREYCRLAEERLKDCLETKRQFEQKASILLSIYMPISLALFGLSAKFNLPWTFNISASILFIAIIFILLSIHCSDYGNLGRHPSSWLQSNDYLTVKNNHKAAIYGYLLYDWVERIDASNKSNDKKQFKITLAIWLGFIAILPFLIKFLFSLWD